MSAGRGRPRIGAHEHLPSESGRPRDREPLAPHDPASRLGPGIPTRPARRVERVETADGRRLSGKVTGDAASGFRFAPDGGGTAIPLESVRRVTFDGPDPDPGVGDPPFHVALGLGQRISGASAR